MAEERVFSEFRVGDCAHLQRSIIARDVDAFIQLTGDDNPVHVDADFAKEAGLGGRVVHGMLTAGFVSTVIGTLLPGPGALWLSQQFRFRAPVRVGDTIDAKVRIRHISPATRILVLDVEIRNQNGLVVLDGEAQVQVHERKDAMEQDGATEVRTVVVTGSGRGIGAAIARRLAAEGKSVLVNCRRDEDRAKATVEEIRTAGGQAVLFRADVSDPDEVDAMMAHAREAFGDIDALVNNAGGPTNPLPIVDTSWEAMTEHLEAHFKGPFLCARAVLPAMVARGFGRIVNVTSQSAYGQPPPKMAGYAIAKAAVATLTRAIAAEAGPHGVTANAVAPGMVDTDMVAAVSDRIKMTVAAQTPIRRLALMSDVAEIVSFLLGPAGAYLTGQTLHVSGGQVMP